jgi:DNA-binding NarL/FixJ family response regulator
MEAEATAAIGASRRRTIKRPRLTRILDECGARIILLVAPAGYGKTTLAHEWLDSKPAAWYRGSPASADVAALAIGLANAAAEVVPGAGERMRQRLRATDRPDEDAQILAEMLGEDLTAWPEDAWLVIDDYQFAMDSPASEDFVETLLNEIGARVLIGSRRRPRWATARRRLYGDFVEVDQTLLAMDAGEAMDVLSARADAQSLVARAAGWPAVIGLAALAGSPNGPPTDVPTTLYDFFAEELLRDVPRAQRKSLCRLAVAPSITAQCATHLLGLRAAESALSSGVEAGVLQRHSADSYELHPLLRAFLLERISEFDSDVAATAARVGDFLLRAHAWDDALTLAREFRRAPFVNAFIECAWEPLLDEGRLATLTSLVDLASELRVRSPLLDLVEAEVAFRQGSYTKAETLASEAVRGLTAHHLLVRAHVRAGQSAHFDGRDREAIQHHDHAYDAARTDADRRDAVWGQFACSVELETSDWSVLLDRFEALGAEEPQDAVRLATGRILWSMRSGQGIDPELFTAIHRLSRVDDPLIRSSFLHIWGSLLVYAGRYEEALRAVEQQIRQAEENRLEFVLSHALVNQALALRGMRRFREGLACLDRAESDRPFPDRVVLASRTVRTGIHIAQGRLSQALAVSEAQPSADVAPNVMAELRAIHALALACAKEWRSASIAAEESVRLSKSAEPHVMAGLARAICALGTGQANASQVETALSNLARSHYVDAFVAAYRGYPPLLREAAGRAALDLDLSLIVRRAGDETIARQVAPSVGIGKPRRELLTTRETEVLALVAQGLRNREIAERLFISEVTVKAHMRSIMGKLGARSRTHAVSLLDES